MSSLLGSTAKPASYQAWYGSSGYNQIGHVVTFPAGGPFRVASVGMWIAGKDSAPVAYTCIWSGGGVLWGYSAAFNLVNMGFALGNCVNELHNIVSGSGYTSIPGGTSVYIGAARAASGAHQHGLIAASGHVLDAAASVPTAFTTDLTDNTRDIGAYLYYDPANQPPNAPINLTPTGGVLITGTDLTPALAFLYDDPDGNPMSAYQVQVSTVADFASTVWDSGKTALVQADNTTVTVSPPSNLSRGVLYYWRARVWDNSDVVSGWSA